LPLVNRIHVCKASFVDSVVRRPIRQSNEIGFGLCENRPLASMHRIDVKRHIWGALTRQCLARGEEERVPF
jgi:hypothetical protein